MSAFNGLEPGAIPKVSIHDAPHIDCLLEKFMNTLTSHCTLSRIGRVLGSSLAFMLAVILCLPVLLLPLSTAAPAWIWAPLALIDLALLALFFRLTPAWRGAAVGAGGALLTALLATLASQVFAATPPIQDLSGQTSPNAIASLEKVSLNGSEQWITLRGRDASNPVLLNLGMGGPGGGGFATRSLFEPLEERFVVVSWDEPGTGKSYHARPVAELTPRQFIDDAHALTLYLRQRFGQEKIYLYGVSWTSILGVWLVQEYPELYAAYIGNGQMVNTTQNDVLGYQLALDYASQNNDQALLSQLTANGPPPYTGEKMLGKYVLYLDVLNEIMGSLPYTTIVPIIPFMAPEYGYVDKVNHTRGLVESFQVVYPQLADLNFTTQATVFEAPVYLFAGREDVNAMSTLVEHYFDLLEAPHKELIWLEGGHGLSASNLPQFVDVMFNHVLAQTEVQP